MDTKKSMSVSTRASEAPALSESSAGLLRELVAHLRQNRTQLREEWARRITRAELLTAMTEEEIFAEATAVYDNYVEALETGTFEALQAYSRRLSERIIPRGVETDEVVGIVLLLRDVLARSLFNKYQDNVEKLNRILDSYEPAANRIANTVAVGFVEERERIIRQQQEAIRELSTPVLQVRERLLILPIIGVIDPQRARQLTEQAMEGQRDLILDGIGASAKGQFAALLELFLGIGYQVRVLLVDAPIEVAEGRNAARCERDGVLVEPAELRTLHRDAARRYKEWIQIREIGMRMYSGN